MPRRGRAAVGRWGGRGTGVGGFGTSEAATGGSAGGVPVDEAGHGAGGGWGFASLLRGHAGGVFLRRAAETGILMAYFYNGKICFSLFCFVMIFFALFCFRHYFSFLAFWASHDHRCLPLSPPPIVIYMPSSLSRKGFSIVSTARPFLYVVQCLSSIGPSIVVIFVLSRKTMAPREKQTVR